MKNLSNKKYHYFYKITNMVNNHFYYGIHSTSNINDGYMGSGKRLHIAYKKYGIENFTKEILKYFNTRQEAANYESEMVTESLIKDDNCYNIILGGEEKTTFGTATVKDKNGNIFQLPLDDERILNGEMVGATTGTLTVKDKNGKHYRVSIDDERYISGELISIITGKIKVIDNNGRCFCTSIDDNRIKTGEFKIWNQGKVLVKNNDGKCFLIDKNDERLLNKTVTLFWEGKKHSEKTKQKQKETYKRILHQQGEKNSQYGTCWITKEGVNKKIKKDELLLFEKEGWIKGRKTK